MPIKVDIFYINVDIFYALVYFNLEPLIYKIYSNYIRSI